MWLLFSDNISVKVRVYSLFDDFGDDGVIFFFFSYLSSVFRFCPCYINNILYIIFLKYDLYKISLLKSILKVFELFMFDFSIFFSYCFIYTV